jgi:VanZ family protein
MLKALSIWAPPFIYVPTIFFLSVRPMPENLPGNMDKAVHLLVYSIVGALFTRTLISGIHIEKKNTTIVMALISSILLGTLIEGVQHFIPYRSASFMDMVANGIGALIGVSLYILLAKPKKGEDYAPS